MLFRSISIVMLLAIFSSSANANLIKLDQSYLSGGGTTSSFAVAQTFTAGITGILDSIVVEANFFKDVSLQIYNVENKIPSAFGIDPLATVSLPDASNSDLVTADVSLFNIQVKTGDMLAFVLFGGNTSIQAGFSDSHETYDGGRAYYWTLTEWEAITPFGDDTDLNFQSYVKVIEVPEPSSFNLLLLSLFILLARNKFV